MEQEVTRVARIALPDGTPVWARISGAAELSGHPGELSYSDTGFAERVEATVEGLHSLVTGVARSLAEPLRAVRPDEVSVQFGIELTAKAGKVVGLLADGEAKAGLTVTLTWNGGPPGSSRTGAATAGGATPAPRATAHPRRGGARRRSGHAGRGRGMTDRHDPGASSPLDAARRALGGLVMAATVRIHRPGAGYALDEPEAFLGSGFLIAPNWVVTCAHVACEGEGGDVCGGVRTGAGPRHVRGPRPCGDDPPGAPPSAPGRWRDFSSRHEGPDAGDGSEDRRLGAHRHLAELHRPGAEELEMINAALYLRRPLLVTGSPGPARAPWRTRWRTNWASAMCCAGPSSAAPASRTASTTTTPSPGSRTCRSPPKGGTGRRPGRRGPWRASAATSRLGPLGTALLPSETPRVLLIDELDKSDIDLPNDLLNVLEEGEFAIPELERIADRLPGGEAEVLTADGVKVRVRDGRVRCRAFPFVVLTSNGGRDFPAPLMRRCIHLELGRPTTTGSPPSSGPTWATRRPARATT
ncbi:hypothetical protein SFUMM280S_00023 [Streptomyces fumanus]